MVPFLLRVALVGVAFLLWLQAGCATHADLISLRQEVRHAVKSQAKSQTEVEEEQRALRDRVQALEVAKESADAHQRLAQLSRRLKKLEARLGQLEETQHSRLAVPPRAGESIGNFPDLSSRKEAPPSQTRESSLPSLLSITPTTAFNMAYNDYLNGRYDLSIVGFQRFLKDFPSTSLAPKAHYWLGESYYQKRDYVRAMQSYERVVMAYPSHEKVPAALFKIGLAAAETGDSARAREYLKRVIEEYSTSNEANLAKHKLAEIR